MTVDLWELAWERQPDGSLRRGRVTVDFAKRFAVAGATVYRLDGAREQFMLEAHARALEQEPEALAAWLWRQHNIIIESTERGYGLYWEPGGGQKVYRGAGKTLSGAVLDWAHRR